MSDLIVLVPDKNMEVFSGPKGVRWRRHSISVEPFGGMPRSQDLYVPSRDEIPGCLNGQGHEFLRSIHRRLFAHGLVLFDSP